MNIKNEIKTYIVRKGLTMGKVVDCLVEENGWSRKMPNFSSKFQYWSLKFSEAKEIAEVFGYGCVWQKRGKR